MSSEVVRAVARVEAVVVGGSAGGIDVLAVVLPAIRATARAAFFIVVHQPRERGGVLAGLFKGRCALPVKEAEDKELITAGTIYFAPPDYHLQVDAGPSVSLSYDEPVNYSRPSIDVLFESAAEIYGDRLLGVVLSGSNQDGAAGLAAVRAAGGVAVVQDPASAAHGTMPAEALRRASADLVLGLESMAALMQAIP